MPGSTSVCGKITTVVLLVLMTCSIGCAVDAGRETAKLPDVDYGFFVKSVQPILERRCAHFACHGSLDRSYQVYAEARLREIPDPRPLTEAVRPLTETELERNFRMTAGLLYGLSDPEDSLLFSKPLENGTRHGGSTIFGGPDVFLGREDVDYQTLLEWAKGARLEEE